ncbi:hypothetical protein Taro_056933, partial [Colocasia esculenta]|nr:hypothetical protein [Colocasia esculenta]
MSKPQLSFPCHNRTPKHHGCLNTLHQTLGDEFKSCWGRVEEFLVAGEQEIAHNKPFFFPVASAATCTNSHLEVDQRRRPCERDGPIGRVLGSCHDSKIHCVMNATSAAVAISLPVLADPSHSVHSLVAFYPDPVATFTG